MPNPACASAKLGSMAIADRVMVLDFGRQIALGSPEQVQSDEEVIRAYLGTESAT